MSTAVLSSSSRVQLVAVGDSLTQRAQQPDGWLTLLSHLYQRRVDVINRGFSGYNSDWLLALIRQQRADPSRANIWRLSDHSNMRSLYVVGIGANDAVLPPVAVNKQHVTLQRYKHNVSAQHTAQQVEQLTHSADHSLTHSLTHATLTHATLTPLCLPFLVHSVGHDVCRYCRLA